MSEPTVEMVVHDFPLLQLSISSDTKDKEFLKTLAKDVKKDILKIADISKVDIYDDSEYRYQILFDYPKIEALGINKAMLLSTIRSLSYTSSIGSINDSSESFFISTENGKKAIDDLLNTLIRMNGKAFYLKDILDVKYVYKEPSIISFFNAQNSINVSISKTQQVDSTVIRGKVIKLLDEWDSRYKEVKFEKFLDISVILFNRFNVVISSLILGVILVGVFIGILINWRTALIVSIGIPFSFLIGIIVLYMWGYSINMMSLLGALIILGVIVDDAIIVAENIERHIAMRTHSRVDAIRNALKEVMLPVMAACFTTIFAFLPLLLLSGEMGEFIKMIPIAVIVLIIGSLVESFFFLPLHSSHILKDESKSKDWSPIMNAYQNTLEKILHHKKSFCWRFLFSFLWEWSFVLAC